MCIFAVLCYKILFAIHPFQASHDRFTKISELIKNGFFVHGSKRRSLKVIPHIHNGFSRIPYSLQKLFIRTFEDGHLDPPTRPIISEWVSTFIQELRVTNNKYISINYSKNYKSTRLREPRFHTPAILRIKKKLKHSHVDLSWHSSNGTSCLLNGKRVNLKGSFRVPLSNHKYVFKLVGKDGTVTTKQIVIKVPSPKINVFSLSNISFGTGIISWVVLNASYIELNGKSVLSRGTEKVNLILPYYMLVAQNIVGQRIQKKIENPVYRNYMNVEVNRPANKIKQSGSIMAKIYKIRSMDVIQRKAFSINTKF